MLRLAVCVSSALRIEAADLRTFHVVLTLENSVISLGEVVLLSNSSAQEATGGLQVPGQPG